MRLVRVEIDRFASRRLARLVALGVLAVIALAVFSMWQGSRPMPADELAMMRESFEENLEDWEENGDQYLADCEAGEEVERETDPEADWGCEMVTAPVWEDWVWEQPTFSQEVPNILPILAVPLAFAAFLVGVSFLAAEFTTGSMGNWLTFEPRRTRVFFSKLAAAALATLPVALAALAVTIGAAWVAYSINDHVGEMTGDIWWDVVISGVRVALLVVGFAALGAALGALVRHTAGAIGLVVGYAVVVEAMVGGMVQGLQPYLLRLNFMAVAQGEATYGAEECRVVDGQRFCEYVERSVSLTHGVVTLSVLLVVGVVLSWLVFRRRDVV